MANEKEELRAILEKSKESFPEFIKYIFPASFKKGKFTRAAHTIKWAKRIQYNKRTSTLSARKHLKSTTIHAYIMWRIFKNTPNNSEKWMYMSYSQSMSEYHINEIKGLVQANPFFAGIKDMTPSSSRIEYTWGNGDFIRVISAGILTFKRGWHGLGVICDDILTDPTNELNLTVIDKINRIFKEDVMSLPDEGGQVHLVGTAQHSSDIFFQLKDNPLWDWAEYKAILNEKNKETLWPELFTYKRLCEIRTDEIGEKAFLKEYMCAPVWSAEAYFQRKEFMAVVDNDLQQSRTAREWKTRKMVIYGGLDIGKKAHPSHFVIFKYQNGEFEQMFEMFMDNWDYSKQVDYINNMIDFYLIDAIYYDDTRSELESFREKKLINPTIWRPVAFSLKTKFDMASNFSRIVNKGTIKLLNRQRMIDSILSVNNDLKAPETEYGHGDAFWSVALALSAKPRYKPFIAI